MFGAGPRCCFAGLCCCPFLLWLLRFALGGGIHAPVCMEVFLLLCVARLFLMLRNYDNDDKERNGVALLGAGWGAAGLLLFGYVSNACFSSPIFAMVVLPNMSSAGFFFVR